MNSGFNGSPFSTLREHQGVNQIHKREISFLISSRYEYIYNHDNADNMNHFFDVLVINRQFTKYKNVPFYSTVTK